MTESWVGGLGKKLIYTGTLDLGHIRDDLGILCLNALLLVLRYKYFCVSSALELVWTCFSQIFTVSVTVLVSVHSVAVVHLDKC